MTQRWRSWNLLVLAIFPLVCHLHLPTVECQADSLKTLGEDTLTSEIRACSEMGEGQGDSISLELVREGYVVSNKSDVADTALPIHCAWLLTTNETDKVISLSFDEFDLPEDADDDDEAASDDVEPCSRNFVKISYFNESTGDVPIDAFCGSGSVPNFVSEPGRQPVLVEARIADQFKGFKIHFAKMNVGAVRAEGQVASCPKQTHFSCPDETTKCIPDAYRCDSISDCQEGGDEEGCDSHAMAVEPISDVGGGEDEEEATTERAEVKEQSGCGSHRYQTGKSGSFTSLNFPCDYTSNLRCLWYIRTAPGTRVLLAFNDFFRVETTENAIESGECPFDRVTLFSQNGQDNSSTPLRLLNQYCGGKMPKPFLAPNNAVVVRFESDATTTAPGFRLQWAAVSPGQLPVFPKKAATQLTSQRTSLPGEIVEKGACGVGKVALAVTSLEGVIRSPNYGTDALYPKKVTCRWRLRPANLPSGEKIKRIELRFTDFHVPSLRDCERAAVAVKIYNREEATWHGLHKYCNLKRPPIDESFVILDPKGPVQVEFDVNIENPSGRGRGFELFYAIEVAPTKRRPQPSPAMVSRPRPAARMGSCGLNKVRPPASSRHRSKQSFQFTRIVGGNPARPGQWRWAAQLDYNGEHFCAGTVINERWLVSAAHCFKLAEYAHIHNWKVVIGRHIVTSTKTYEGKPLITPKIASIYLHSGYNGKPDDKRNDIALIKLAEPLDLNGEVSAVCLPSRDTTVNDKCIVVGWGDVKDSGGEGVLKEANLPIIDTRRCRRMNDRYMSLVIPDSMICAGFEQGGTDACQGDSGGPLMCFVNGRWELHGVVSFGKGCAGVRAPGVYTRVHKFLGWIHKLTKM